MPRIPNHPCAHPGCPNLVPRGKKYCDDHIRLHSEEIRSAARRGYGSKWQRVRKRYLKEHPLCVECLKEGRYVPATDIDHIVAHRGDATGKRFVIDIIALRLNVTTEIRYIDTDPGAGQISARLLPKDRRPPSRAKKAKSNG